MILNRGVIMSASSGEDRFTAPWNEAFGEMLPPLVKSKGLPYSFDTFEPYYGLFFWLLERHLPILYLDAKQWEAEPNR